MSIPFASAVSIDRYTDGSYDSSGDWSDSAPTPTTVQAHIQPYTPSGRDADQSRGVELGAQYLDGLVQIYSESELYTIRTSKRADRFTWNGQTYEVTEARQYNQLSGLEHWSCIGTLINANVEDD